MKEEIQVKRTLHLHNRIITESFFVFFFFWEWLSLSSCGAYLNIFWLDHILSILERPSCSAEAYQLLCRRRSRRRRRRRRRNHQPTSFVLALGIDGSKAKPYIISNRVKKLTVKYVWN